MKPSVWLKKRSYHFRDFSAIEELVRAKKEQQLSISLCIPTFNEEKTIRGVIECYQERLIKEYPLLDEIVVIDGRSRDRTIAIVEELGVPYYFDDYPLSEEMEKVTGKGEALWKSLYFASGDLIIWSDSDIKNPDPRFAYGILGPLLQNEEINFVKACYRRPLQLGDEIKGDQGGRVTELVVKPMLSLFFPPLRVISQPLSGEYGGRREVLEKIPFSTGYGVESGLLIDIFQRYGLESIAQVDLEERIHENQDLSSLKKMSFCILQRIFSRLEEYEQLELKEKLGKELASIKDNSLQEEELIERERPPMEQLPIYRDKF